jgi:hypothetical protein
MFAKPGQDTGSISEAAFSFIVQEPREIIEVVSDTSLDARAHRYRIIEVSDW